MVGTILSGFSQSNSSEFVESSEFIETGLGFDVPKSEAAENWLALLDEFDPFLATEPKEFKTLLTLVDTAPTRAAKLYCEGMLTVVNASLALFEERLVTSCLLH